MSEEAVILHGAPTLAGIKTGSLGRRTKEKEKRPSEDGRFSLVRVLTTDLPAKGW